MYKKPVFLIFALLTASISLFPQDKSPFGKYSKKFEELLRLVSQNYVDSVDIEEVTEAAYKAMLGELDKQSVYFPAGEYKRMKQQNTGNTLGIGITQLVFRDTSWVFSVQEGSPADSAGIRPGDRILFIDAVSAAGKSESEVTDMLNGAEGSQVSLITSPLTGSLLREHKLTRRQFHTPAISAAFLIGDSDLGYIKSARFSDKCYGEFKSALDRLKSEGMSRLVIDLRGNPGGYLDEAQNIISLFLDKDKIISKQVANNSQFEIEKKTSRKGEYFGMPLILLLDETSASASEVMAGAIQDYDRGLVVGETSYGKGTAQKIWEFGDSSAVKITVAKYRSPSGRDIQKSEVKASDKPVLDPATALGMDPAARKKLEEQLARLGGKSKADIKRTEGGRPMLNMGGIFPDIGIAADTTTQLTNVLSGKRILFELVYDLAREEGDSLKREFGNDYKRFDAGYPVTNALLEKLHKYSLKKNIWNKDMFESDRKHISCLIRARLAQILWGDEAYYYCMIPADKQIMKALENMAKAEQLIGEKK